MFNNINAIIEEIIKLEGFEVMNNHILFFSLLNDLAPMYEEERKILKKALDKQALLLLKKVLYDKNNKESIENFIFYLDEELGIKKEWIEFILKAFDVSVVTEEQRGKNPLNSEKKPNDFSELLQMALAGDVRAQCAAGYCYISGTLVNQDKEKGLEWYKKAALSGFIPSQYNYASLILNKEKDYNETVVFQAKDILKLAVKSEHIYAMHYYAIVKSRDKEMEEAIKYYEKSSCSNDTEKNAIILNMYRQYIDLCKNLPDLYLKIKPHFEEYERCIKNGSEKAQYNLAREYQMGENVNKDLEKAYFLFKKSAELGDYRSWFDLGYCYENGLGVQCNYLEAERCYEKGEETAKKYGFSSMDREFFKSVIKR